MAGVANTWLVHGAVKRGVWCEVHSLPHMFEYSVYAFGEPAAGFLSIALVKEVKKCDLR